jgi:hypothetical protein
LQALADEARQSGNESQLQQAEAEFLHHYRKDDRGDAVLQVIERMAGADQAQGETLLPVGDFGGRDGERRGCGWFIVHEGSIPWGHGVGKYGSWFTG